MSRDLPVIATSSASNNPLFRACLNADLEAVKSSLNAEPQKISILLSTEGTENITHLGIARTGTPLQMALYAHDKTLFNYLADLMDPAEVQRQCEIVFANYKVANYNELVKELKNDAAKLCNEFIAVFSKAPDVDVVDALLCVAGTKSPLQEALNLFDSKLDQYVRANPVHNPYVLQRLIASFDSCEALSGRSSEYRKALLSGRPIGLAQKLSSARWLQLYVQEGGLYYKQLQRKKASSSLFSVNAVDGSDCDIPSLKILSTLGAGSCIDAGGHRRQSCREIGSEHVFASFNGDSYCSYAPQSFEAFAKQCVSPFCLKSSDVKIPDNFLFKGALNADLGVVKAILKAQPQKTSILLSTEGTENITHLGIARTGTPLQMALYAHDKTLFNFLADLMDPAEVQRQCERVFANYKVADYNELVKKLENDAAELCDELIAVFSKASDADVENALLCVAGTKSPLQEALNLFDSKLDQYVRANPVHNPYIFQRLIASLDSCDSLSRKALLSGRSIGLAQKLSSVRWLQLYAQDGGFFSSRIKNRIKSQSTPFFDVNVIGGGNFNAPSLKMLSTLGAGSCIDAGGDLRVLHEETVTIFKSLVFAHFGGDRVCEYRTTQGWTYFVQRYIGPFCLKSSDVRKIFPDLLFKAALNADLEAVKAILKAEPQKISILLSTEGTENITHLGIARTGTPLQMALYAHDKTLFNFLADLMDPAEVQRQCERVFANYKVADYNELVKKLENDAAELCDELITVFSKASDADVENALLCVDGTKSPLQEALNLFDSKLDQYVRANPVHNPYILQRLIASLDSCDSPYRKALLSGRSIGLAQKLSSARWLQLYVQDGGFFFRGYKNHIRSQSLSFFGVNVVDGGDFKAPSLKILSTLGAGSCIDAGGIRTAPYQKSAPGDRLAHFGSNGKLEYSTRGWAAFAEKCVSFSCLKSDDIEKRFLAQCKTCAL